MQAAEQFVRRENNDPAHWPKTNLTEPRNWACTLGFTCSTDYQHKTQTTNRDATKAVVLGILPTRKTTTLLILNRAPDREINKLNSRKMIQ